MAQCKWCEKKASYLTVNKHGLCKTCADLIQKEVFENEKIIRNAEKKVNDSKETDVRTEHCDIIIENAKNLLKYENKGIHVFTPPPSELIQEYTEKHDKIIIDTMPDKVNKVLEVAELLLNSYANIYLVSEALEKINDAGELLKKQSQSMKIISIANQKGGVGKTTSTINIGAGLALLNKKVLLVDFDPQANLTDAMGIKEDEFEFTVYELLKGEVKLKDVIIERHGLSIIPSNVFLTRIQGEFFNKPRSNYLLKEILEGQTGFDYVFIDCLPSLGILTLNALMAAHEVYIPFQPEYLALTGISKLLDAVEFIKEEGNRNLRVAAIIGTRFNRRLTHHREAMEKIQEGFRDNLLYANIRENIALAEASSFGHPIFKYRPKSNGAKDYMALCIEILKRDRR